MTTTITPTLQNQLNNADPNEVADILRQVALGDILTGFKRTFTGLAAAATYNLTALDASGETAGSANPNRRGVLALKSLRVTAATTANTVGSYALTDAAGTKLSPTASTVVGLAQISDDGTTLTFPTADVTAFVIEYIPTPLASMTASAAALGGTP